MSILFKSNVCVRIDRMNQIYDLDKMHLQTIRIRREYPFRERKSPVPLAWQQKQAIIETNVCESGAPSPFVSGNGRSGQDTDADIIQDN
jgi:hypothetical protein